MMRIEHLGVYVRNLEGAKEFFETYLGGRSNGGYHNPKTGFRSYFLTFDGGARLEIMHRDGLPESAGTAQRAGLSHLAFSTGNREAVDALTERLRRDGYKILSGPRVTGDGYYESSVEGFEGILIEITA